MSLDIQIKVDPGDSVTRIQGVTDGLKKSEQQGKNAGEAMLGLAGAFKSLATAMQQEQTALGRLSTLHEQLAVKNSGLVGSFAGLAQSLQREQDLLERIQGPAREAQANLTALNMLYQKGAISSAEYVSQLKQMNNAIENTSKASKSGGGMFAGIGTQLGGLGALGTLGVGAAAIYGAKELAQVDDKYTVLENSAKRFVTAGHDVNDVLRDQRQLARDLHQDMNESMRAYQIVKEANDGLNFSYEETIRLDKTYGEAAQLNGRSTEDLAQQMQNLRVAFETGTDASRPLRAIFKEFPQLASQWSTAMGLNVNQLYNLARSGKLSFEELERAGITNTAALDKAWAEQTKTMGQHWGEFTDEIERPLNLGADIDALNPVLKATKEIERQAAALRDSTGLWSTLGKAEHDAADGVIKDFEQISVGVEAMQGKFRELAGIDPWAGVHDKTGVLAFLPQGTEAAMKYAEAVGEAKRQLAELNAAAGHMNEMSYRGQRDSLLTTINGELPEYYKQLEEIQDPQRKFNETTAALNQLLKEGKISWGEYEIQLEKATHAYGGLTENEKEWMKLQRDLAPGLAGQDAVKNSEQGAADLKKFGEEFKVEAEKGQHARVEMLTKQWHGEIEEIDKQIEAMRDNARTVLDPVRDALHDFITKGTVDIEGMFKHIGDNVVSKMLDRGETSLLQQIFGKTSQEFKLTTQFTTGGEAAGGLIANAMTAAGATVAAQIAAAMGTGATASGLGGLVWGTAGSAGTDSIGALGTSDLPVSDVSSVARTTPGSTPGIQTAARGGAGGGGGGQTVIRNVTYNVRTYDRRAIIDNRDDDERFTDSVRRNPNLLPGRRPSWAH